MPDSELALPEVPQVDYVERWRLIVERRRAQMDAAYDRAGLASGDYWARRAKSYRKALHDRTDEDPFFVRVRDAVDRDSTIIDAGAGTGRHTLALAPYVRHVTAVDPSPAMLGFLRDDLAAHNIENVETLQCEWQDADVGLVDVVLCSHVLYPIADVVPFVRKLEAAARRRVFIYLRADPLPTDMGLWSEFYGVPLQAQPVHMDLVNVLAQIDIFADVEIVEHRFTLTFDSLDEAQEHARNSLCLRPDDGAANEKLRRLLEQRLVSWSGDRIGPPVESARSAIISWRPTNTGE